ncbi:MAG: CPBP family intramembrane metalloprotease [Candidatus Lokiarchaeota archaeon]|nr:CPBP family intramembrane metalloprotease [Candidatus Lokiarchaeota archaeon]MBD3200166.1 CPBP family intramembrane metalloprotease [Candidatus Lokiarchaeota archaeon]
MDPWILISITFLELLFLIIPTYIAKTIETNSLKEQFIDLGFTKSDDSIPNIGAKIILGFILGIFFFLIGGYILYFFTIVVVSNLFGADFLVDAQKGAISTQPLQPNILQLFILIMQQIFIIAVCEEFFFRAFLIEKISYKLNVIHAMIISSLFFAIYHVPPFLVPLSTIITYFGYYFFFALLLGTLYIVLNQSLLSVIVAHSTFNILVILL